MSRDQPVEHAQRLGSEGFALPIVIWSVGAIALLFVTYVAAARHRMTEAVALATRARAEAAASIGVQLAIIDLLQASTPDGAYLRRFGTLGEHVSCALGDGSQITIAIVDEGGKVDLNTASPELVHALLRAFASDDRTVSAISNSILDYRADLRSGRETDSALASVFELDQLSGLDRNLTSSLIPLTTIHSRSPGIDPATAPSSLLRALSGATGSLSRGEAMARFPTVFSAGSERRVFLVSSEAILASGARFARDAVIELTSELPSGYRIREWRDGTLSVGGLTARGLSAC
jgi:general secretion pathway protein K